MRKRLGLSVVAISLLLFGVASVSAAQPNIFDTDYSKTKLLDSLVNPAKTIYYLPYASFNIRYPGMAKRNYKQVIFLGTVESASCNEAHRYSFKNEIAFQFTEHIEAYETSKLGEWHAWSERIGYWRWADKGNELYGLRARIAKRYPNKEFITGFVYRCR